MERAANSSSESSIVAAATLSSTWATLDVPGMGSITGERRSSQATRAAEALAVLGSQAVERTAGPGQLAGGQREPGDEGDPVGLDVPSTPV